MWPRLPSGWPPIRRMRRAYPLPMETAGRMKPRSPLPSRVSKEKSCRRRPCTAPRSRMAAAVRPGAKRPGGQRPRQRSHGVCAGPYGAYTRTWGAFARSLLQGILCAYPVPRFGRDAGLSRAYALSAAHTRGPFGLDTAFTLETLAEKAAQGTLAGCLLPPETGLGGHGHGAGAAGFGKGRAKRRATSHGIAFAAQGVSAEQPFGLRLGEALLAVAQRQGDEVKVKTWLAE